MLLKAERILTQENYLLNASEVDVSQILKHELTEKIVSYMIEKGLVKIETVYETNEDSGPIVKIRATTRAYNPDD